MVILDTDHLTIIQRQNQPIYSILSARFRHIPASDLCTTIISVEEQMRGWLAVIGRSRGLGQERNDSGLVDDGVFQVSDL